MSVEHSKYLDNELGRLIGALGNGVLSDEDCAQLDRLVTGSGEARRIYNNYMFLHAELFAQNTSLRPADAAPSPPRVAVGPAAGRNRYQWLAIAATLAGVAAVSSWLTYAVSRSEGRANTLVVATESDEAATGQESTVARITATRNCFWKTASSGVGFGSRLEAGRRLELQAGLVEITFDDGAAVVLEGPATFDVRTRNHAQLVEGRLSAVVPQRASGFQVATAQVNVIDVGTEFGLMAESKGATEIHVFNGLVKAQLLDTTGKQVRLVELNTAEGARIQPATAMVARIPVRDDDFVRSLSVTMGPHDGLYAYDGFNYPAGPLAEQNGGFGWAGPWFNIEAEAQHDATSNGVATGSLEYQGVVPLGNRAVQTAHQNRVRRSLGTSVGGVFDAAGLVENQDGLRLIGRDGTTVYFSFMQRVDSLADVFYGLELHRSDGNGNRVLCVGHGAEGTGYGVTSNVNVYGPRNYPSLGEENTEVNFFVIRIDFGAGNHDRVEVFRNPNSLNEEAACIVNGELTGNFAFDRISLGNFHGSKVHEVDEIRVGTTFRSVTGRRSRGPDRLMPRVAMHGGAGLIDAGKRLWIDREETRLSSMQLAN